MQTDDPSNLFQTTAEIAQRDARSRKAILTKDIGEPISATSKVIRMIVRGQDAWVAESGWLARRVCLKTGKAKQTFRGHKGPCTSLALWDVPSNSSGASPLNRILFTGSWDKSIKAWNAETGDLISTTAKHTDFVKSLLLIPHLNILISGSSDKSLAIWDTTSLLSTDPSSASQPLKQLAVLKQHTRPIDCLELAGHGDFGPSNEAVFFSGDSMGVIRSWNFKRTKNASGEWDSPTITEGHLFPGHHTTITQLLLSDGGLISCSADSQILYHPYPPSDPPKPPLLIPNPPYPETCFIRSILVLPPAFHTIPLLLAGAADEDIRVYDLSEMLEFTGRAYTAEDVKRGKGRGKELARIKGHFGDVTALGAWVREKDEGGGREPWVVSGSTDGTIRRWSMKDVLNPPPIPEEEKKPATDTGMTEEEELELAELMDTDED